VQVKGRIRGQLFRLVGGAAFTAVIGLVPVDSVWGQSRTDFYLAAVREMRNTGRELRDRQAECATLVAEKKMTTCGYSVECRGKATEIYYPGLVEFATRLEVRAGEIEKGLPRTPAVRG
jgi:hypothetical protein